MFIMVVDGQGGGMGKSIIEKLRPFVGSEHILAAFGTNSIATANMIKAGADKAATGENAIKVNAARADIIMGSIGIISSNSMFGELSHEMARAISESDAEKILIPIKRCGIYVAGITADTMPKLIDEAVDVCVDIIKNKNKTNCN